MYMMYTYFCCIGLVPDS